MVISNYTNVKQEIIQQKNHTGVNGRAGLCAARSVEVEHHTERGNVTNQNVHIPTIKIVMEVAMKRRSAMSIAAKVR